jgi:sugar lactone lactonase YvrE
MRTFLLALILLMPVALTTAPAQESVPWTTTDGPNSGAVQCFVFTPAGQMYIGTDASGIYRSSDGQSWKRSSTGLIEQDVRAMAVGPNGELYAMTYVRPYASSHIPTTEPPWSRVYWSTNEGVSWTAVDSVVGTGLLVDHAGYVWTRRYTWDVGSRLLRSTDHGNNWETKIPTASGHPGARDLAMDSSGALYLGMSDQSGADGTYRSTNNGDSWTKIVANITLSDLAINSAGLLFGIEPGSILVRLKTNGTVYTVLDSEFTARSLLFMNDGSISAVEEDGSLIRSTDNGVTWRASGSSSLGALKLYTPDGTTYFMTSEHGRLMRSTTGRGWTDVTGDLRNSFIPSLLCTSSGDVFAGAQDGVWRATDKLGPWTIDAALQWRSGYPPRQVWAMGEGSGTFRAAAQEVAMYVGTPVDFTKSLGRTMTTANGWQDVVSTRTGLIVPLALTIGNHDTVYIGGESGGGTAPSIGKYDGSTFRSLSGPLNGKLVYALARNADDTLFAGTLNFGVFRSATHGTTWKVASNGLPDLDVYALAVDPDGRVFAGTGTGLYISKNNGDSWTAPSGFPSVKVQAIAVNGLGHVYVATTDYVWMSATHGTAPWVRLKTGLPMADITSIAIGPDDDVYAGTWGEGVYHRPAWLLAPAMPLLVYPANMGTGIGLTPTMRWQTVSSAATYHLQVATTSTFTAPVFDDSTITDTSRTISLPAAGNYYWRVCAKNEAGTSAYPEPWKFSAVVTGVETDQDVPATFVLDQNHPNPFNPSTVIRYGLPVRGHVRLVVYSALGQELAVLADDDQSAGYHEVTFAAGRFASGVYICRMEAGGAVYVRKMVLIR